MQMIMFIFHHFDVTKCAKLWNNLSHDAGSASNMCNLYHAYFLNASVALVALLH